MREVELRDVVLRLPGVTGEQAQSMALRIARRLADTVPEWRERDVPELATLRVQVPAGAGVDDIVRHVVAAVGGALR